MQNRLPPQLPTVLLLGVVSQIGQVLILRELLMQYHGNEATIGVILAAWMLWVGVGCRLGTCVLERRRRPWLLLLASTGAVMGVLPLTLALIRLLRGFFDILPGSFLSLPDIVLSSFLIIAPLGLALGAQFIILARIWREYCGDETGWGAGCAYIWEVVGNMLGGILFTFVMVHYMNSFETAVLAGGLMLAAALISMVRTRVGASLLGWLPLAGLAVIAAGVWPWLAKIDFWAYQRQWRHFAPQYELVDIQHSKHGTIAVARRAGQYSFFQSGHLMFSTAGPQAAGPGFEEQEGVSFVHLTMVQHQAPGDVLLIGGGWRGTLGEMIKHPIRQLDYVELDERLTAAVRPTFRRPLDGRSTTLGCACCTPTAAVLSKIRGANTT